MSKLKVCVSIFLIVTMCLIVTACDKIELDTIFNKGPIQAGYTSIETVEGIKFAVPTKLKESAATDEELLGIFFGSLQDQGSNQSQLPNFTLEGMDDDGYMLMNFSDSMYMVNISSDVNVKNAQSVEDFGLDNLELEEGQSVEMGKIFLKETQGKTTKVLFDVRIVFSGEQLSLFGYNKDIVYSGYIAAIENEHNFKAIMIAVTRHEGQLDTIRYCAKTLDFTSSGIDLVGEDNAPEINDSDDNLDTGFDDAIGIGNEPGKTIFNTFKIDGNTFTLPCSYQNIKNVTGYYVDSADENTIIKPDNGSHTSLMKDNNNYVADIKFYNGSEQNIAASDAQIVKISVENDYHEIGNKIEFAHGISIGEKTTIDELVTELGEYDEVWNYNSTIGEEYSFVEYTWETDNGVQFTVAISKLSGCIEEISVDANIY